MYAVFLCCHRRFSRVIPHTQGLWLAGGVHCYSALCPSWHHPWCWPDAAAADEGNTRRKLKGFDTFTLIQISMHLMVPLLTYRMMLSGCAYSFKCSDWRPGNSCSNGDLKAMEEPSQCFLADRKLGICDWYAYRKCYRVPAPTLDGLGATLVTRNVTCAHKSRAKKD